MGGNTDYGRKIDIMRREALRKLLIELPEVCYDFMVSIEPRTSILTRLNYAYDFKIFFSYLSESKFNKKNTADISVDDISNITARDIEMFLEYLSYYTMNGKERTNNNSGKKRKLCSVRSLFKYLYKHQYIKNDVTSLVGTPKIPEKPILKMDYTEVRKLFHNLDSGEKLTPREKAFQKYTLQRDKTIMILLLGTGIRISECVGLNINDIDFEKASFIITRKGGNKALLYLPAEVMEELENYMEIRKHRKTEPGHENALFLSMQNSRITARAVQNMVKKYAGRSIPLKNITPHKFRSTYGTNLYNTTGDIYLVADVLGHKDVNTTKRHYAAINEEKRRIAAQVTEILGNDDDEQ